MSEEERDRIIQEHERNLAELESRYWVFAIAFIHQIFPSKVEVIKFRFPNPS